MVNWADSQELPGIRWLVIFQDARGWLRELFKIGEVDYWFFAISLITSGLLAFLILMRVCTGLVLLRLNVCVIRLIFEILRITILVGAPTNMVILSWLN